MASPPRTKLAEQVVRWVEERIFNEQLPVGFRLGRESDLSAQIGVSRWPFREGLRLLEATGLVEIRRGVQGGIFVGSSVLSVACYRLSSYLEFVHAGHEELAGAFHAFREGVIRLAHERIGAGERARVAELNRRTAEASTAGFLAVTAAWEVLHEAVANPALTLFTETMSTMVVHAAWYSTLEDADYFALLGASSEANHLLLASLIDGDLAGALALNGRVTRSIGRLFESSSATGLRPSRAGSTERAYHLHPPSRPAKKAEEVERQILQSIRDGHWVPGTLVGSESDLMVRYGVGRSVLREAVRSLERLGAVTVGRGGASGLRVTEPDPGPVVEASRRFLRRERLDRPGVGEAGAILDSANLPGEAAGGRLSPLFRAILDASQPN